MNTDSQHAAGEVTPTLLLWRARLRAALGDAADEVSVSIQGEGMVLLVARWNGPGPGRQRLASFLSSSTDWDMVSMMELPAKRRVQERQGDLACTSSTA